MKRRAVITGAGGGIGRSLVESFRREGYEVIATDQGEGDWISCDLADAEAIERFVSGIDGPIHALVNNAGIPGWHKSVEQTSVEEWDHFVAVDLRAPWLLTKLLLPKFGEGACVVNIASLRTNMTDDHNEPYSACKAGLIGLTQSMAVSLGRSHGLRVNAVSPGWIVPPGTQTRPEDEEIHPVGRTGRPEDISETVLFLCSERASFITGVEWFVDGGMRRVMAYPE